MQTVARIVEDVANEYGANAATAVSRAKAVMQEKADEGDFLPPWELGEDVFEDAPQMRERIRAVMRYAGPRMITRHPVAAVRHLLGK